MSEVDLDAVPLQQRFPENPGLLALADGIGGNEGAGHARSLDVPGRFEIPRAHVVQDPGTVDAGEDPLHLGALAVVLPFGPPERRIPQHGVQGRGIDDGVPIHVQRVAVMDVGRVGQGNAGVMLAEFRREFPVHLVIREPERRFRDAGREFLQFDAVKLVHVHLGKSRFASTPN